MPRQTAAWGILAAMRVFLAVALFAGIIAAFRIQRGQRRKALARFRRVRLTGDGEAFFVRHATERNLADYVHRVSDAEPERLGLRLAHLLTLRR